MKTKVNLKGIYVPSKDVVAREVGEEFIIIPITLDIGDLEDKIFTLNGTGRAIWDNLNGKRSLKDVARGLSLKFEGSPEKIEKDVIGLAEELLKRRMLVETK